MQDRSRVLSILAKVNGKTLKQVLPVFKDVEDAETKRDSFMSTERICYSTAIKLNGSAPSNSRLREVNYFHAQI